MKNPAEVIESAIKVFGQLLILLRAEPFSPQALQQFFDTPGRLDFVVGLSGLEGQGHTLPQELRIRFNEAEAKLTAFEEETEKHPSKILIQEMMEACLLSVARDSVGTHSAAELDEWRERGRVEQEDIRAHQEIAQKMRTSFQQEHNRFEQERSALFEPGYRSASTINNPSVQPSPPVPNPHNVFKLAPTASAFIKNFIAGSDRPSIKAATAGFGRDEWSVVLSKYERQEQVPKEMMAYILGQMGVVFKSAVAPVVVEELAVASSAYSVAPPAPAAAPVQRPASPVRVQPPLSVAELARQAEEEETEYQRILTIRPGKRPCWFVERPPAPAPIAAPAMVTAAWDAAWRAWDPALAAKAQSSFDNNFEEFTLDERTDMHDEPPTSSPTPGRPR